MAFRITQYLLLVVCLGIARSLPAHEAEAEQSANSVESSEPASEAKLLELAENYAKAASGGEKNAEYYRVLLESALKLKQSRLSNRALRNLNAAEPTLDPRQSPFVAVRARVARRASIFEDKTWQENFEKWRQIPRSDPLRIFGGVEVPAGELPDCVAVGTDNQFCCTGTVIGPNVVLTAAHCIEGGCTGRIYIGNNSNKPETGQVVAVKKSIVHPDYDQFSEENDLALLILKEHVTNVTPRPIADSNDIDAAPFLVLAGFGLTEFNSFGRKLRVEVIVASPSCGSSTHANQFGCNRDKEIVAGGNGLDSCNGNSGGPAYVKKSNGQLVLAGATSRAAEPFNPLQPCGPGGIYVRVDKYKQWIQSTAAANGGELADED